MAFSLTYTGNHMLKISCDSDQSWGTGAQRVCSGEETLDWLAAAREDLDLTTRARTALLHLLKRLSQNRPLSSLGLEMRLYTFWSPPRKIDHFPASGSKCASTPFEASLAESTTFQPWAGNVLLHLLKPLSQN